MATANLTEHSTLKADQIQDPNTNAIGSFDKLPTEIRWRIYGFASQKPTGAALLLKQWLEQIDPNVDTTQPVPNFTYIPIPLLEEDDGSDDVDSQATQERDEDGADDDDDDGDDFDEDDDEDMDDDDDHDDDEIDEDEQGSEDDEGEPIDVDQNVAAGQTVDASALTSADEMPDADQAIDGAETVDVEQDVEGSDMDDDNQEDSAGPANDGDAAAIPTAATVVAAPTSSTNAVSRPGFVVSDKYVGRRNKYQHAIPIFKLNGCPPPLSLLQTCNTIHDEAVQYCYEKLVLEIDVFQGFSHLTFLEETVNLISGASSAGPLDRIRKVKLMFYWDSAYLEKYKDPQHQLEVSTVVSVAMWRAGLAYSLIMESGKFPHLKTIEIEWHDSLFTQQGMDLQLSVLDAYGEQGFIINKFDELIEIRTNVFVGTESQPWKGKRSRIKYLRRNLREVRTHRRAIG